MSVRVFFTGAFMLNEVLSLAGYPLMYLLQSGNITSILSLVKEL